MKKEQKKVSHCIPQVIGSTVMGERGQMVVPKEIRECYNLKSGDKFFVLGHGTGPIILMPANQMHDFMDHINKNIESMLKMK
jgi:AbrB family looped-hinge helix DNA binding protein